MGGLSLILEGLNSSDVRLQENCAFVLGSAVARYTPDSSLHLWIPLGRSYTHLITLIVLCLLCSNPVVQVQAMEGGALQTLLTTLATTQPLNVKKKVPYSPPYWTHSPETEHWFLHIHAFRSCLRWPASCVTSPTHRATSCHVAGCRFCQSSSGKMLGECWEHGLSPCCMIWSVRRYNTWYTGSYCGKSLILTSRFIPQLRWKLCSFFLSYCNLYGKSAELVKFLLFRWFSNRLDYLD